MDEVAETGEEVVVTKRGKPIVRVLPPVVEPPPLIGWGAGAHVRVEYHGDIVAPLDTEDWDMDERNLATQPTQSGPAGERD